ncbi:monocarboxylate transporter 14-like [Anthonomus grandis grandis]|uniref:monocarboxylate transporter 14-like n=1 Tax=Anthonomus grandis grandis TaxID=2921223 RepID=UPI0021661AC4|nr:monocarboxylate transporter 14-like [Anthonomus grandis grandis]XP_050298853.1 monocarboxylate transporter 14-like [Anthonomus grandis grandis]XP_050298854.1 monocarboxylate transporter 14-like [Anthonomus grandis grandis]
MEADSKITKSRGDLAAPMARMSKIAPESVESMVLMPQEEAVSNNPEAPNIPDGGWGWIVVFATFVLCMVADGVTFSFGMLYTEFLKEFEASKSATSWIGSLFMAVPLLTGPIMSALVDKFGCRSMTMLGGVISASGFILSSKCYSLSLMYVTFGVLAGLGLGLIYVTVVVSVAFWFDKKRTLAVGIGSSGIGIGTFVFSPLSTYLITEFGWRGTTMILGGCFLNMCVCGALMRDPDWIIKQNKENNKNSLSGSESTGNVIKAEELKALLTSETDAADLFQQLENSLENDEDRSTLHNYFKSAINIPTFVDKHSNVPTEVLELLSKNKSVYNTILTRYPSLVHFKARSLDAEAQRENGNAKTPLSPWYEDEEQRNVPQKPALTIKGSQHEKYFKNMKMDRHSFMNKGSPFGTNKYRFKASSCPDIYRVSMVSLPKQENEKWYTEILDLIKDMSDCSLFLELHFFCLSLSTIILFTWFIVPYFYLAELMVKSGYTSEQAAFTISNIGISNTIGMLFLGWAGDRSWMNITKTYAICLVLCGLSIMGQLYFVKKFIMLQICSSLFGIALSSHFAFTPGIVMELVPLDRFTVAYGLQLLCQGIGTLVGPPVAGFLFDITKKWEQSFYQAGIWIVLSGIFVALIPYLKNKKMIGKGPVEKVNENYQNKLVQLVLLLICTLLCFTVVFYLTGTAIYVYLSNRDVLGNS